MIGEGCMVDMNAHVYHSMFGRGYNYNSLNLHHNYFLATYIIAGEKYSLPALMTFYQNKPELKVIWKQLYDEAIAEGREHREFISSHQKQSFDEIIGVGKEPNCDGSCRTDKVSGPHFIRPWDQKNQDLYGKHLSFVREFDLREEAGKVMIGNLEITDPDALNLYNDLKAKKLI
jgi:hypothetical protein